MGGRGKQEAQRRKPAAGQMNGRWRLPSPSHPRQALTQPGSCSMPPNRRSRKQQPGSTHQ